MDNQNSKSIYAVKHLLTPHQAAAYLNVTSEQVRRLIRKGQLQAANVGTGKKRPLYRITHQALDDIMNRSRHPCPSPNRRKFRQHSPAPDFFPVLK